MKKTFWPVVLIVGGVLILFNSVFGMGLPVFKILLAFALVWGGVTLLGGGVMIGSRRRHMGFGSSMNVDGDTMDYCVAFDDSVLDLSKEDVQSARLEVNCAFGKALVILPANRAVHIKASGAFCSLRAPNGKVISFGEGTYDLGYGEPLYVEASCAFGDLSFREADRY